MNLTVFEPHLRSFCHAAPHAAEILLRWITHPDFVGDWWLFFFAAEIAMKMDIDRALMGPPPNIVIRTHPHMKGDEWALVDKSKMFAYSDGSGK